MTQGETRGQQPPRSSVEPRAPRRRTSRRAAAAPSGIRVGRSVPLPLTAGLVSTAPNTVKPAVNWREPFGVACRRPTFIRLVGRDLVRHHRMANDRRQHARNCSPIRINFCGRSKRADPCVSTKPRKTEENQPSEQAGKMAAVQESWLTALGRTAPHGTSGR